METAGTRFEVRVGTLVSQATLAAFRLPLARIPVPRRTLYRLRIPADQDVPTVLRRLTEHDVEVVEIRQCMAPRRREDRAAEDGQEAARPDSADPGETVGGLVLPFHRRGIRPSDHRPGGGPTGTETGA